MGIFAGHDNNIVYSAGIYVDKALVVIYSVIRPTVMAAADSTPILHAVDAVNVGSM